MADVKCEGCGARYDAAALPSDDHDGPLHCDCGGLLDFVYRDGQTYGEWLEANNPGYARAKQRLKEGKGFGSSYFLPEIGFPREDERQADNGTPSNG